MLAKSATRCNPRAGRGSRPPALIAVFSSGSTGLTRWQPSRLTRRQSAQVDASRSSLIVVGGRHARSNLPYCNSIYFTRHFVSAKSDRQHQFHVRGLVVWENHDEPTWFRPSFEGYDAVVPFFLGQSRLRVAGGHLGSNIKVEAHNGRVCWFYVGAITSKEITWTLREGDTSGCSRFELFRRYK